MKLPEDLLKTAALGTEQRLGELSTVETPLDGLVAQYGRDRREAQLLLKVAGIALRQQAGYQPLHGAVDVFPQAPFDRATPCSRRAVRHLLLMLEGVHSNLLPVWLDEVKDTGQRVPAEILPLLLSYGSKRTDLREHLIPVIGERGKWLAELAAVEKWRWVFDATDDHDAYDNPIKAWQEYFHRLRLREPERAREMLIEHWSQLETRMKHELLLEMKAGLSHADEAFLQERLADEWTMVPAARMLCAIPDSEFGVMMRRAAEQILLITRMGRRNRWVIDFVWSSAFEGHPEHMTRNYAGQLMQEFKSKWTPEQMLSFVPLSYWYEHWQVTPEILVEGARNSTNPYAILEAWTQMAIFEEDSEFALALLRQENPNRIYKEGRFRLITLLNPEQMEAIGIFWLDRLRQGINDNENHPAIPLLENLKQRWSTELMLAFLGSLERSFADTVRPLLRSSIRLLIEQVAAYFSLEMIDEVKRVLKLNKRSELSESELEIIDGIVAVLDFQQEMIRAIRNRED